LVTLIVVTPISVTQNAATLNVVIQSAALLNAVIQSVVTQNVLVGPGAALVVTRVVPTLVPNEEQEQVAILSAVGPGAVLVVTRAVPTLVRIVVLNEVQTVALNEVPTWARNEVRNVGSNAQAQCAVPTVTPDEALSEVPRRAPQVLQYEARA
jgi:hypothetical protein